MTNSIHIGIAGLGTVGVGVCKLIEAHADLYRARTGKEIRISAVSARTKNKDRGIDINSYSWADDPVALARNDEVDVVIELLGGADGAAHALVKTALENGKHVVTANKALIATHGTELATLADKHNVQLAYEAAVAGGIPIIKAVREGLSSNVVHKISGIMNGTCNFILTAMDEQGRAFDDVLKEAQEKGYAEADPTFDIEGIDTAHKLSILTSLAFGVQVDKEALYSEGITQITQQDMQLAAQFGYVIRLLGVAEQQEDGSILQRVHPCFVPKNAPLAPIAGVLNAVEVQSNALGTSLYTGAGAGEMPTASAVVSDVLDIAANRTYPAFGVPASALNKARFTSMEAHACEYYLRVTVPDAPGVLSDITTILGDHDINVNHVHQELLEDGNACVALITHHTKEAVMQHACEALKERSVAAPMLIRIEA